MGIVEVIGEVMRDYSLQREALWPAEVPLLARIRDKVAAREELVFILPAFPAKSPSGEKTSGELPDLGEVLALQNLQRFCDRIGAAYPPGARVVICSDGRAFSDVVHVADPVIDRYNDGIKEIIRDFRLDALSVFNMDDLYPEKAPAELRELLTTVYGRPLAEVKARIVADPAYRNLFNGLHRFLFEDAVSLHPGRSRTKVQKASKENSYELLRRSEAWSELLRAHFPGALRLSIHPHDPGHEKFGIKLVPSSSKWATPWHNVAVKIRDRFELMHKREALALNAVLKLEHDRYAYFEV
jgi:pyoverdine/dityrosine biosynthesis protein Dit1